MDKETTRYVRAEPENQELMMRSCVSDKRSIAVIETRVEVPILRPDGATYISRLVVLGLVLSQPSFLLRRRLRYVL